MNDDSNKPPNWKKKSQKSKRYSGICKRFGYAKKYGFITSDGIKGQIFAHQNDIKSNGIRCLNVGELVEFDLQTLFDGRKKALNITAPNGAFVQGKYSQHTLFNEILCLSSTMSTLQVEKNKLNQQNETLTTKMKNFQTLQTENNKLHQQNQTLTKKTELKAKSDELIAINNSLQTKNEELKQENSRHRTKVVSMEQELVSIRRDRDKMQKTNMQLKQQNNNLLDEKKEYELKVNELKDEISKLKLKCIDVSKYESWKYEEIILWIMSLDDGRFEKYYDVLLQHLKEEGIEGSDLKDINEIDLKSWGVKSFKDKKMLLAKLKQLTENNFRANNIKDEGALTAAAYI